MVSLRLSFLGPFQVFLDSKTLTGFDTQKTRALLAYLAVENTRPHSRETLAGLLWPDRPQSSALSSLRNALANLRKVTHDPQAQPSFFLISRDSLQFNPQSDAWTDVGEFEKLSALNRLESAIDLYRGEFLEGFSLTGSSEFEAWMLVKRQTYQRLALELLHTLAVQSAHIGQTHQALTYTRRILALEPWDEAAHQQVMLLLALTGQRTAALAQYKSCQEILNNELGVEPNQETTHLYEQIRAGEIAGLPSQASTLSGLIFPGRGSRLSMGPLFADRQAELERLSAALRRVLAGKGQVVFINGSPGSGKTFLVQAFIRQALASHPTLRAATGRCQAYFGQGDPYLPFREALEMLTGRVQEGYESGMTGQEAALRLWRSSGLTIQTLVEEGPALVGTFLPGAALFERACKAAETHLSGFPSGPSPEKPAWLERLEAIVGYRQAAHGGEGLQQAALFSQFTNLMCSLARQAPLVLFLDDMQWADLGSLSMLFSLGRGISNASILIVGAYRGGEIQPRPDGTRHPLAAVLNEFRLLFPDPVIDLDKAEERPFIDALLDEQPNRLGTVFRQRLHRLTRAHPLYTVELLRGMQERGDLVQNREGEWVEGVEIHWDILPGRVEAAISERIERLPADLHACLQIASVEGEGFTVEVISEVQGREPQALRQALSEELGRRYQLVRAEGITRVAGQRLTRYRFRHILFQRYLYSQLDPVMRLDLHEQVGQALQRLYAGQPGEVAGQLAHHFERAGLLEKAVHYLGLAGERAADQAANQEAVAYFTHALELVPEADLENRFGLLLKRWEIFSQTGQTGREVEDVQALEELAETQGPAYRARAALCRLTYEADVISDEGQKLAQAGRIRTARAWAHDSGQMDILVQLYYYEAMLYADSELVHSIYLKGLNLARQAGLTWHEARILRAMSSNRFHANDQARIEYGLQALHLYRKLGDRYGEGDALGMIALNYRFLGDYFKAQQYWEQARDICREVGNRVWEKFAILGLAVVNILVGRPEHVVEMLLDGLETMRLLNISWLGFQFVYNLPAASMLAGDPAQALIYAEQMREFYSQSGPEKKSVSDVLGCLCAGLALLALDRLEEAADAFRQSVSIAEDSQHIDFFVGSLARWAESGLVGLAAVALKKGDPVKALEYIEKKWTQLSVEARRDNWGWIWLTCYLIFQANADPRADQVLEESHRVLLERAARISDEAMRRCYLENIPEHREILALWQAAQES